MKRSALSSEKRAKENKMKDFEIRCDESHIENNHTLYGKFTLGPFLPGQGTTFGNALRRSLLSELSGLGITAFEILGVMQEFSTLSGLRESVLDLSLNLKQVVFTGILPCSSSPIGFLKVRGPAVITAADLKLPAGVYCASPEQYIATLASNGILNLRFVLSVGKGHSTQPYSLYRSLSKIQLQPTLFFNNDEMDVHNDSSSFSEQQNIGGTKLLFDQVKQIEKLSKINPSLDMELSYSKNNSSDSLLPRLTLPPVSLQLNKSSELSPTYVDIANSSSLAYGNIQKQIFQRINPHQVLPIDAVFTPVSQVNFLTQVNDRFETARENIVLEIWTNGSIHPKRALEEATLSLVQNFDALLKNIQHASSFHKGIRYWNYLQLDTNGVKRYHQATTLQYQATNEQAGPLRPKVSDNQGGKETTSLEKKDSRKLPLHRAIYNLDIGNLNLSLETFILLKKSKIKTLSQLLTNLSSKENNVLLRFANENIINELTNVFNQLGITL